METKNNLLLTTEKLVKEYRGRRVVNGVSVGVGAGLRIAIMDKEGKVSRCAAEEIGSAKLDDAVLTIRRKDAKSSFFNLFNHAGIYEFNWPAMHNARLFLYLFEKSIGIRVR